MRVPAPRYVFRLAFRRAFCLHIQLAQLPRLLGTGLAVEDFALFDQKPEQQPSRCIKGADRLAPGAHALAVVEASQNGL